MSKKKDSKLKCENCNLPYDFYIHVCKRAYQEYLGCKVCDDWCFSCTKNKKIKGYNMSTKL